MFIHPPWSKLSIRIKIYTGGNPHTLSNLRRAHIIGDLRKCVTIKILVQALKMSTINCFCEVRLGIPKDKIEAESMDPIELNA